MANLSSYTAVYVRSNGNDLTGNGSSGAPFATAQAAFNSAYARLNGLNSFVLDFGAGSFSGVNLATAGAANWPVSIAVRGVGSTTSYLGGITASGTNGPNPTTGKNVTVISDNTINLGGISTAGGALISGSGGNGANGGNVTLTDCVVGNINAAGSAALDGYSNGGFIGGSGGNVALTNCVAGSISNFGATASSGVGGNGGDVTLVKSTVGIIENYGGNAQTIGGNGGVSTISNSYPGNIDSRGGYNDTRPNGESGTAVFSGYSSVPDYVYAYVVATELKQGKGVNGSAILGIV
jgi:hypothetical protein